VRSPAAVDGGFPVSCSAPVAYPSAVSLGARVGLPFGKKKRVDRFLGEDLRPVDFGSIELSETSPYLPEGGVFCARTERPMKRF
jgi:hypothetical protein